jgi:integrase
LGESGKPDDSKLVFPYAQTGGFVPEPKTILKVLYAAMDAAKVERVGPTGEKRTFHSLRLTYAKTVLERGSSIFWLSRQLGHSSVMVTDTVYWHWERKAAKREAAKMKGAFSV